MTKVPLPWDLMVFLTITTVGFGYSISRFGAGSVSFGASDSESRQLSSVSSTSGDLLDLGCLETQLGSNSFVSEARSLRLKGQFCNFGRAQMRHFQGINVKNLTTGYESTIFLRGSTSSFVSDHIALKSGKNVLHIVWRERPGADLRRLETEVFER